MGKDTQTLKQRRLDDLDLAKRIREQNAKNREMWPNDWMPAYRPSSKMKEGVESLPTHYHKGDMTRFLSGYKTAQELGAPKIPPEKLAAIALIEGRSDFGYNAWNTNNPRAVKLYNDLLEKGVKPREAGFSAAILDKYETAKRLKIPFEHAWHGTGKSIWNTTGRTYSENVKAAEKALSHPSNKDMYEFIRRSYSAADDTQNLPVLAQTDTVQMPEDYSDGNWKLI